MEKNKKPMTQKPMYNQNIPAYNGMYQPPMVPGNYPNLMMPGHSMNANYSYSPYGQSMNNYPAPEMNYYYPPYPSYDYLK